jgi:hypothetical protein
MNIIIDTMLDYTRLVCYALVILTSLRGIAYRKFTGLLFRGDIILAICLITVVVYIHLFEISVQETIIDDVLLTIGATTWAVIHFVAMLKENKKI